MKLWWVASTNSRLSASATLRGVPLAVRPSSSYYQSLLALQKGPKDISFNIVSAPEEMETEELIGKVADGTYDLTLADSHILGIERTFRNDVREVINLDAPGKTEFSTNEREQTGRPHVWVVRTQNKHLLSAINTFFEEEYRGTWYNLTYRKYFRNKLKMKQHSEFRATSQGQLSPYDELIKKHAGHFGFDWILIAAQMYTESRFDPNTRSWVGARGLMQVMPRTGKQMGITLLEDPDHGILAGCKYMDWLSKRIQVAEPNKIWFTLAAYNAGLGHVLDARQLAREHNLNPDRWYNHVEKKMLLLAKPKVASRARFGYCRGSEPVAYVRTIRQRANAYRLKIDNMAKVDFSVHPSSVRRGPARHLFPLKNKESCLTRSPIPNRRGRRRCLVPSQGLHQLT